VKLIPAEEGLVNLEHKPYEDIENGPRKPMVGGPKFQQERVSTKLEVILDKIGRGTALGYSGAWRQWALFCKARRRDPYLLGETRAERHADEEILLEFVVHLLVLFNRTEGTLKGKLLAIRFRHLLEGLEDPLKGKSRLQMALGGIKRRMGKPKRKWPVILKMLVRIWQRFGLSDNKDEVVLACAAVTAWFFLLRSGEYVANPGQPWQLHRVVRGGDVFPRKGGEAVQRFEAADEVVLNLTESKTDQYNAGHIRNHYRAHPAVVCPVVAMEKMQEMFPERFSSEASLPLFRAGKRHDVDA